MRERRGEGLESEREREREMGAQARPVLTVTDKTAIQVSHNLYKEHVVLVLTPAKEDGFDLHPFTQPHCPQWTQGTGPSPAMDFLQLNSFQSAARKYRLHSVASLVAVFDTWEYHV